MVPYNICYSRTMTVVNSCNCISIHTTFKHLWEDCWKNIKYKLQWVKWKDHRLTCHCVFHNRAGLLIISTFDCLIFYDVWVDFNSTQLITWSETGSGAGNGKLLWHPGVEIFPDEIERGNADWCRLLQHWNTVVHTASWMEQPSDDTVKVCSRCSGWKQS